MTEPIEVQPTYLETLVGEGKKYPSVEELAKAYTHASAHITERKQHEEHLMSELDTLKSLTALLTQAKTEPSPQPQQAPELPADPVLPVPADPPTGGDQVDVESVVANFLARKEAEQRQQSVYNAVVSQFAGDQTKAAQFIADRAKALGVDPQYIVDAAAKSSQVAFELLGLKPAARTDTPVSRSDINAAAFHTPASADQGWTYYENLRQNSPGKRLSSTQQKQLEADLMRLGPSRFYGKE